MESYVIEIERTDRSDRAAKEGNGQRIYSPHGLLAVEMGRGHELAYADTVLDNDGLASAAR